MLHALNLSLPLSAFGIVLIQIYTVTLLMKWNSIKQKKSQAVLARLGTLVRVCLRNEQSQGRMVTIEALYIYIKE